MQIIKMNDKKKNNMQIFTYIIIIIIIIYMFNLNRNVINKLFTSCVKIDMTYKNPKDHSSWQLVNYGSFYIRRYLYLVVKYIYIYIFIEAPN